MKNYTEYKNRTEWLKGRKSSLGASEVAICCGMGFKTPQELWEDKTGKSVKNKTLEDNPRIEYGTNAEEHLRALFALQNNTKYKVEFYPFRIYKADNCMSATLDGELIRLADNKRGIWECKTAWVASRATMREWEGANIPNKYYIQLLAQLYVTGFEFAVLSAQLIYQGGNSEIRHYTVERAEVEDDIKYIVGQAEEFWEYVKKGEKPPVKITL